MAHLTNRTIIGHTRQGRPIYQIAGGAQDGDGEAPPEGQEGDGEPEGEDGEEPDPVAQAVERATRKANKEAEKWRRRAEENASRLEERDRERESEQEKALREAREQAKAEAKAEHDAEIRQTKLETAAVKAAAGKVRPEATDVAIKLLLEDFEGEPDEMPDALDQLLTEHTYLKVDETRPSGSSDAGSRQPPPSDDGQSLGALIKAAVGK